MRQLRYAGLQDFLSTFGEYLDRELHDVAAQHRRGLLDSLLLPSGHTNSETLAHRCSNGYHPLHATGVAFGD